ncbi:MAG: HD domain-containing protein [Burkholderiales bacterium]
MSRRGNEYDVSCRINTTEPAAINAEVDRIFLELYPKGSAAGIDRAFRDMTALYRGAYPGYHPCDTAYHDIQHVLDVTLATARLIDGYERGGIGLESLDASMFSLGIVTALFHDCGYVRTLDDTTHKNGGELTLTHVSRGARFLKEYLPKIGMGEVADIAAALIHFTGYEIPVAQIKVPSLSYKLLGSLLGSADIIAQMSDRCYLEKCRDRLYPEFVAGGIARKRLPNGEEEVVYASGEDLVIKTPRFYEVATRRLDADLGGCHKYAEQYFGGQHLYLDELEKNIQFALSIGEEHDTSALKRKPPETLAGDSR